MSKDNSIIIIIFTIDYFYRFYKSKNKKKFFKNNIIDLISIIPFGLIFQGLKLLRLSRLIRITKLFKSFSLLLRFRKHTNNFIKTNNFNYVLLTTLFVLSVGSVGMHFAEGVTYENALWWSFVTITTVGYGDLSPRTTLGRIIASILMLVGIGFLSMLTGTISTFFLKRRQCKDYTDETIKNIQAKLDKFDELTLEDIDAIYKILKALKE